MCTGPGRMVGTRAGHAGCGRNAETTPNHLPCTTRLDVALCSHLPGNGSALARRAALLPRSPGTSMLRATHPWAAACSVAFAATPISPTPCVRGSLPTPGRPVSRGGCPSGPDCFHHHRPAYLAVAVAYARHHQVVGLSCKAALKAGNVLLWGAQGHGCAHGTLSLPACRLCERQCCWVFWTKTWRGSTGGTQPASQDSHQFTAQSAVSHRRFESQCKNAQFPQHWCSLDRTFRVGVAVTCNQRPHEGWTYDQRGSVEVDNWYLAVCSPSTVPSSLHPVL